MASKPKTEYEKQKEDCVALLSIDPTMNYNKAAEVYEVIFKKPLTRTPFSDAKAWVERRERIPDGEKQIVVRAIVSVNKNVTLKQLDQEIFEMFGEHLRGDLIEAAVKYALENPYEDPLLILNQYRAIGRFQKTPPTLGLLEDQ